MKNIAKFITAVCFLAAVACGATESEAVQVLLVGKNPGLEKRIEQLSDTYVKEIFEFNVAKSIPSKKIEYRFTGGISKSDSEYLITRISNEVDWDRLAKYFKWNVKIKGNEEACRLTIEYPECNTEVHWLFIKNRGEWVTMYAPEWPYICIKVDIVQPVQ